LIEAERAGVDQEGCPDQILAGPASTIMSEPEGLGSLFVRLRRASSLKSAAP
jgi:hypothetical protein